MPPSPVPQGPPAFQGLSAGANLATQSSFTASAFPEEPRRRRVPARVACTGRDPQRPRRCEENEVAFQVPLPRRRLWRRATASSRFVYSFHPWRARQVAPTAALNRVVESVASARSCAKPRSFIPREEQGFALGPLYTHDRRAVAARREKGDQKRRGSIELPIAAYPAPFWVQVIAAVIAGKDSCRRFGSRMTSSKSMTASYQPLVRIHSLMASRVTLGGRIPIGSALKRKGGAASRSSSSRPGGLVAARESLRLPANESLCARRRRANNR